MFIKTIEEVLKSINSAHKNANLTFEYDFGHFNIFYTILNDKLLLKVLYTQGKENIIIKQFEFDSLNHEKRVRFDSVWLDDKAAKHVTKSKRTFILRIIQKQLIKKRNPQRFELNKLIHQSIEKVNNERYTIV